MQRRSAIASSWRGFTLIELLVVLTMVALLLTIALPRYFASLDQARDVALKENLKVLRISLDRFHADKGHLPAGLDDLVEQKYLRSIPLDPVTESSATWVILHADDANAPGVADVRSGAAGAGRDGVPYEQY